MGIHICADTGNNGEMVMDNEEHALKCLAIGRLMRIASRPYRDGDMAEYARCRAIIMGDTHEVSDWRANYVRDRLKGAPGQ